MGELVNVVVAVALIALVVRWFATGEASFAVPRRHNVGLITDDLISREK